MGRTSGGIEYPIAGYPPGAYPPGTYPPPNGGAYPPSNGLNSYPPAPAPQSYLRPEQVWQPYQEADEDDAGHIMQSWNKYQPYNNTPSASNPQIPVASQPGPGYQPVPTTAPSSTSSGFARVKGGRAHYDSPFAIRAPARPSPLSSQVHLPPGARPPELGAGMRQHSRTKSQTVVVEDASRPVVLEPSTLPPPQIVVADDDDSPASSEPTKRKFWFGRSGGGEGSQDDTDSGGGVAVKGGKGSMWPFGKRRRGSEADVDWMGSDEGGSKSGGGFVVMRKGPSSSVGGGGDGGTQEGETKPSFSVIRQPRPGTGGSSTSQNRQSTIG